MIKPPKKNNLLVHEYDMYHSKALPRLLNSSFGRSWTAIRPSLEITTDPLIPGDDPTQQLAACHLQASHDDSTPAFTD